MDDSYQYLVATQCVTYNHAPYIEQTLKGFSIQNTTFPAVFCIVDDASTDGEQEVLTKWAEDNLIPDNTVNGLWSNASYGRYAVGKMAQKPLLTFVILLLFENHYWSKKKEKKIEYISPWRNNTKYLAFCEGDDYWTDPNKLKKQADILESSPNVTLVYSSFKTVDETGQIIYRPMHEDFKRRSKSGDILHLIIRNNFILTLTVCMRSDLLKKKLYTNCPVTMDWSTFLVASMFGDFFYMPEETGCYRKVKASMLNSHRDNVNQRATIIRDYYSEQYVEHRYKKVSFSNHTKIYCAIAANCINDRHWSILKHAWNHPYFLLIFILKFIEHIISKCIRILTSIQNENNFN